MRIYNNAMEMVREVERDLFEMGIRVQSATMQDKYVADNKDYETLEMQAYTYMLTKLDFDKLIQMIEYMEGNLQWADHEFADRMADEYINPGITWKLNGELWEQFLRDGQFAYTYNERFREQLPQLVRELTVRPNSRQAIITMYDRHQDMNNWGGKDRVPCSMYYQFYIRDEKLHMIYTMRSCDFLTHFCHDVYMACRMQLYVGAELGLPTGNFTHFIGSLHAYNKDMTARGIF